MALKPLVVLMLWAYNHDNYSITRKQVRDILRVEPFAEPGYLRQRRKKRVKSDG